MPFFVGMGLMLIVGRWKLLVPSADVWSPGGFARTSKETTRRDLVFGGILLAGGLLRFALYCVGEAVGFYAFEDEVSLAQAEVVVGSPELVLFIFVPLLISGIGVLALVVYMTIARVWMARRAKGRTAMRLKDKAICALVFVVGFLGSWTLYKATGVFLFGHDPSFLLII